MLVRSFDRSVLDTPGSHFGLTSEDIEGMPFQLTYGSVPPGTDAQRSNRSGEEVLFIVSGSGTLVPPAGGPREVAPGDAVHITGCFGYELMAGNGAAVDYVCAQWHGGKPAGDPVFTVRSFDRDAMVWTYEMYLQDLYDAETIPGLPFGSVFGAVAPTASRSTTAIRTARSSSLIGAPLLVWDEDPCSDTSPDAEHHQHTLEVVRRNLPWIASAETVRVVRSFDGYATGDSLLIPTGLPRVWFTRMGSGGGAKVAPPLGQEIAQRLLSQQRPVPSSSFPQPSRRRGTDAALP